MSTNVIYKIRNVVNGKFYVGSAKDTRVRFRQHRKLLRKGTHHCKHLQAAWNKYGEDVFKFEVVERLESWDELEPAEDRWLAEHVGQPYCYNSGRSARAPWRGASGEGTPFFGHKHGPEALAMISAATKEQWRTSDPRTGTTHSEETKQRIAEKTYQVLAEGRGGKFIPTEETRRKMSEALKGNQNAKGHVRSEEHRRKLAESARGNQHWLGRSHTMESREKMSKQVREITTDTLFVSLSAVLDHYGLKMPTLRRALKTGKPISRGPCEGLQFRYEHV